VSDGRRIQHIPALIAAHMRAAASRRPGGRTGPFLIGLDAHSDDPMRNYAVPDAGARPGCGDADALIAFFRDRHRIPRLEYIEEDAPLTWPALAAAGFTIERRTPVMTATPATRLTPRSPAGISIRPAADEAELAAAAAVQHHAYQTPQSPGAHDIARLTRLTRRGGLVAIAVDESSGTVAGTGLIDVASDRPPVGEIAAVGVLAPFRGRGIASALSVHSRQDRPLPGHRPGLPRSRTERRTDLPPHRVHRRHHQDLGLDPLTLHRRC
jgi:hypothetical protein